MKNRFWNRMFAFFNGYFWLSCPLCDKKFGGHEWKSGANIAISYGTGEGVCPDCAEKAKKISEERMKYWLEHGARDSETGEFLYNVR